MKNQIGILNYRIGNLSSIQRMINKVGGQYSLINKPNDFLEFNKIILPGVGHFVEGVRALQKSGLWDPLLNFVEKKDNLTLGICLGMQLLCKYSEEGNINGLDLVNAKVIKFDFPEQSLLKVPHMGWNTIRSVRANPLIPIGDKESRFYFVHSYKVVPNDPTISIGLCNYGGEFCAAFQQENIFGVQFHPEKSHRFGMELVKRFVEL
jgi:glutamine amidotransferase